MTSKLNSNVNTVDIYQYLRDGILIGKFHEGERLPSQSVLCQDLNAPRHVLRKALQRLQRENLIVSWQGRGTYVRSKQQTYEICTRTRFGTNMQRNGCKLEIKILPMKRPKCVSFEIARLLGVSTRDVVNSVELMHYVDDEPIVLGRHYSDPVKFPDFQRYITETNSVPKAFSKLGIDDYTRATTFVEVRKPSPSEAIYLDIPQSQPIMELRGQNKGPDGTIIEVTHAIVRGDRVQLKI